RCVGATGFVGERKRGSSLRARPRFLGRSAREDLRRRGNHLHLRRVGGPDRLEYRRPLATPVPIGKRLADLLLGRRVVALAEVVPAQRASLAPEEDGGPAVRLVKLPEREFAIHGDRPVDPEALRGGYDGVGVLGEWKAW